MSVIRRPFATCLAALVAVSALALLPSTSDTARAAPKSPRAPRNLVVTGATGTSISISWDAPRNSAVVAYAISVDSRWIATTTETAFGVSQLACATPYVVGVSSIDAQGTMSAAATVNASTLACAPPDATAPTAPTNLTAVTITTTSIALEWTAASDETGVAGYDVYLNGTRTSRTGATTYTAPSLACGTSYTFAVAAFDAAGNVSAKTSLSASTAPCSVSSDVLPRLEVVGNRILRDGRIFVPHGVNRDSLEWGRYNWGGCGGDGHFTDQDYRNIKSWNVTVLRVPLSQAGWLGRRCDAASYRQYVDTVIRKASANGMYVILDLHWSDVMGNAPCDSGCTTGQQPMPDSDSIAFWHQVAARYANDSAVLFGLYNEPHGVSWPCWRDGGCLTYSSRQTGSHPYTAVGMQQLYDVVRATGAKNLVIVGGLDWAYDLSGVAKGYALSGANIVYDTHVYTRWHYTLSDWKAHFGDLTAEHAIIASEFGSTDCSTSYTSQLIDYFDAPNGHVGNRMGWMIWSWNVPGSCGQPSIIADWHGAPLAGQGQLVHDALKRYAAGG